MRIIILLLILWVVGLGTYLLTERFWPGRTGAVYVTSDPPGAEIWMDLEPMNRVTPAELRDLSTGKHSFTVRLSGHRAQPFVQVVTVGNGSLDTLRFAMEPDGSGGSSSAGRYGSKTPPALLPPRQETISERVKKEEPWEVPRVVPRPVDTTPSSTTSQPDTLSEELREALPDLPTTSTRAAPDTTRGRADDATGSVEITSSVAGATIVLNDKRIPERTPTRLNLPLGTHTVRVELQGYTCKPEQQDVRLSRVAGAQNIHFTLTEEQRARKEFTVTTTPVQGGIFVDGDSVGYGLAVFPHDFGVFLISYGDVPGYQTPEATRLAVTPANPHPTVTGTYSRKLQIVAQCNSDGSVTTVGDVRWEVGLYDRDKGARVSETHGPKISKLTGSDKYGWELAMGDPNRNPTGADYVEFIFTLPDDVPPSAPLNLRLYIYRTNRKYPLSLSSRCEVTATVNGRLFLDNFRPRHDQESADSERYEEWSLQYTLVPGENRIMVRTGEKNQIFNYLWKFEVQ